MNFIGQDQYGFYYHIDKHPRKELKEMLPGRIRKMYMDTKKGVKHIGYVVGNLWVEVYEVKAWRK